MISTVQDFRPKRSKTQDRILRVEKGGITSVADDLPHVFGEILELVVIGGIVCEVGQFVGVRV